LKWAVILAFQERRNEDKSTKTSARDDRIPCRAQKLYIARASAHLFLSLLSNCVCCAIIVYEFSQCIPSVILLNLSSADQGHRRVAFDLSYF